MNARAPIAVVGDGIFAVTAAAELLRRGRRVDLFVSAPDPHPLAESTDISKIVRLDYGADVLYTALMEQALDGWRRWNAAWPSPLFHETGVCFMTRTPMTEGAFEHESFRLLSARGHRLLRLDAATLAHHFPAWSAAHYPDGYYNPAGGWAESGEVVRRLRASIASEAALRVVAGAIVEGLVENDAGRVTGLRLGDGSTYACEEVVIAAGAWTPRLVPHLAPHLRTVGQPVFHLRPANPMLFTAERFPVFGADIARTGYYGFPITGGVVKIANHGIGRAMAPDSPDRIVTTDEEDALRTFLRDTFPALAEAPTAATRVCVYCDTRDEHFWIARDPDRPGLTVATGGSGHAFKFAPLLGEWIADAVDGVTSPALDRFRWRTTLGESAGEEAARHRG